MTFIGAPDDEFSMRREARTEVTVAIDAIIKACTAADHPIKR